MLSLPSAALLDDSTPVDSAAPPQALLGSRAAFSSLHDIRHLCQPVPPCSESPMEP